MITGNDQLLLGLIGPFYTVWLLFYRYQTSLILIVHENEKNHS